MLLQAAKKVLQERISSLLGLEEKDVSLGEMWIGCRKMEMFYRYMLMQQYSEISN